MMIALCIISMISSIAMSIYMAPHRPIPVNYGVMQWPQPPHDRMEWYYES